jgi:hypothetical protein
MAHYRGPHVAEFIIGRASRDPLAHAGYLLTSQAAASVPDCFLRRPFQFQSSLPDFHDGDANATFGASCCASSRIVVSRRIVPSWRRRNGSNGAHRLRADKTQQIGPAQAGQAGVHKAGAGPAYRQTEPGGSRSSVHGGPPGRTKSSKVTYRKGSDLSG